MSPAGFSIRLRRCRAAWPAALLLAACAPAPESSSSPMTGGAAPAESASTRVEADHKGRLRGYYEAREGGLFTACGETSRRHVRQIDAGARAVLKEAGATGPEPQFIVASGDLVGRDDVSILAIDLVTTDAFDCETRLDGTILGGRGTQGLWTLEVTAAAVNFSPAPGAKAQVFPYRPMQASHDSMLLESANADGGIRIGLQARPCSEKMTGTTFGLAATIQTGDQSYSGCAWRGLAGW